MTRRRNAQHLRVSLLGRPRWTTELDSGELQGWRALVIALLALEPAPKAASVAARLWPAAPSLPNAFTGNLNRLRDAVDHVVCDPEDAAGALRLTPRVSVDVLAPPQEWPRGADPAEARFLHGVEPIGNVGPWLEAQRAHWARALALNDALRTVAELEVTHQWPEALAAARAAVACAPDFADGWLAKARALYLNAELAEAGRALARARALPPLHGPSAERHLADLAQLMDPERAAVPPRRTFVPASLVRPPRLIGREAAWQAMSAAWAAGHPFVLVGDAGVGKSRLLQDFASAHDPEALRVDTRAGDERAPYALLGAVLRQALARQARLDETGAEPALPPDLAALVGAPAGAETHLDALAVLEASEAVLQRGPGMPALVIEDLARADLASIEALRALAERLPTLRLAFSTRVLAAAPRRDLLDAWAAAPNGLRTIDVQPWTQAELAQLLATVALPGGAADVTPAALLRSTGGVAQLVLWELQRLSADDDGASLSGGATARGGAQPRDMAPEATGQPGRLLAAVPPSARPLLELAAVADLTRSQMAHALACSDDGLAAAERTLEALGVMVGGRWAHALLRDAAVAMLPPAALRRWNAVAAALLAPDPTVPRARVASHWEAAGRWAEAGAAYQAAGMTARDVGRREESRELLRHAAACHARAGDKLAEFWALRERLVLDLAMVGPDQTRPLVERLEELADLPVLRARALLAEALRTIWYYRRDRSALDVARVADAAARACADDDVRAEAMLLLGQAQAMAGDHQQALALTSEGFALARLVSTPRVQREAFFAYIHTVYEASRVGEAVTLTRECIAAFEAAGDAASVASLQCNLARLLLRVGTPQEAEPPARAAQARHERADPQALELETVMNRSALARSLVWCGRFAEARAQLNIEDRLIGSRLQPMARGEVQLTYAGLMLLLGDASAARDALGDAEGWSPNMQLQRSATLARIAAGLGEDPAEHWRQVGELFDPRSREPLPHQPWLEWACQGDAREVNARLKEVQQHCLVAGMPGVARSVALRRIDRLLEIPARWAIDDAARLATGVRPDIHLGLHPGHYLPEALHTLARAFRAGGEQAQAAECETEARQWIVRVATHHVPPGRVEAFLRINPWNRALLVGA